MSAWPESSWEMIDIKENLLGAYYAINFTMRWTMKHSDKKRSSHPTSVHFYLQPHQTIPVIHQTHLQGIHDHSVSVYSYLKEVQAATALSTQSNT